LKKDTRSEKVKRIGRRKAKRQQVKSERSEQFGNSDWEKIRIIMITALGKNSGGN